MSKNGYILTNDFRILYCPNMQYKLSCKELDIERMKLIKYEGDLNLIELFVNIDAKKTDLIIKNIFKAEIGIELPVEEMNWLCKFELLLEKNNEIINNQKLLFNYSILKLKLAGFPEDMAVEITSAQFKNKLKDKNYPNISIFIDKIDELINNRKFWIPNGINFYKIQELNYLKTIFTYKDELKNKFTLNLLNEQYLKVIHDSFIPYLIEFNSNCSYIIKKPLSLTSQVPYILDSYNFIIKEFIYFILNKEFPHLLDYNYFINELILELNNTVNLYLSIILEKENKSQQI